MPNKIHSTTQSHLDIAAIRDGLVILKDGGVRLVLSTTAVNFDLLSEIEQDAAIEAYASLLNSISFKVQILLRSKKMDISQYLGWLESERSRQSDPKRRQEITEYEAYIKQIIAKNEVLDKKFYVVLAYDQVSLKPKKSLVDVLLGREARSRISMPLGALVKKALLELEPKRDHIIKQFSRIGIKAEQIQDQALVELFYSIYNQDISRVQKVGNVADRETLMVQKEKS